MCKQACHPVRHAVILAAGMGRRLRGVTDLPKGLVPVGGTPAIERAIGILATAGIARVTIITGYRAECYAAAAASHAGLVELVHNPRFATTGTVASLRCAAHLVHADFLLIESDLVYERRAVAACLDAPAPCATLVSGWTGAGDEVFVTIDGDGALLSMSKQREALPAAPRGEFVGITKLTPAALDVMLETCGDPNACYDTDALVALARRTRVSCVEVPDLIWGEIDDEAQFARVQRLFGHVCAA